MGLLSTLGKIAGGAIGFAVGGPGGAAAGAKIGGTVGKAGDSLTKKKSSGSGQATQYIQSPTMSLDDIRSSSSALSVLGRRSEPTKVAQAAKVPGVPGVLEDPWKPMYDWWEDLGGEPGRIGPIDETRMP